ncbi:hypothetical protein [Sorangium sp. So ce363]|uniref:hypothetical protein n=1 Tax=Sorangium sp. So ce363 TaxID=3133304 RepID=UPI003F5DD966
MNHHVRKEKLGLTAMSVASISGALAGFIKIGNADGAGPLAILDEAKNQGLHVAGHLPASISAVDASNAGWRAVGFVKTQISSASTRRHGPRGRAWRSNSSILSQSAPRPRSTVTMNFNARWPR